MALGDYIYLLDPQSGDTSPHNELNAAQTITGGTTTLVDRGGGDYVWEFSGGLSSGSMDSASRSSTTPGNGWTQAITFAVVTYPTVEFTPIIGIGDSSGLAADGTFFGRNGAGAMRARISGNAGEIALGSVATSAEFTWVQRVKINASGSLDYHEIWKETTGRSGTASDFINTSTTISNQTLDTIQANAVSSGVYRVKNWAVWYEELSDADCAALADDLRGTLALDGGTDISGALGSASASGFTASVSATTGIACALATASSSGFTATLSGTLVTDPLKNNTATVLASETGVEACIYDPTDGTLVVKKTGLTTDAGGVLTISDALLVAGTTYWVVIKLASGALGFTSKAA